METNARRRTRTGSWGILLMLSITLLCSARGVDASDDSVCQAEQAVDRLVAAIRLQHVAIIDRQADLDSLYQRAVSGSPISRGWHLCRYLLAWISHQVDTANDYWRIGSMESTLLIAYSKLGAVRQATSRGGTATADQRACQMLAGSSVSGTLLSDF